MNEHPCFLYFSSLSRQVGFLTGYVSPRVPLPSQGVLSPVLILISKLPLPAYAKASRPVLL